MTFVPSARGLPVSTALEIAKRSHGGQRIASQTRIAKRNWDRIFGAIVVVDGPSARDIAEITGLAQGTVTGVLEQLKQKKLIVTVDPEEEGVGRGRRPRTIRVNPEGHYVVGVELTPDVLTGVVVDLRGDPIGPPTSHPLPGKGVHPDLVVDGVRDLVDELVADLHRRRANEEIQIHGLGVEVGGHIDSRRGIVVFSPNLGWFEPIPLRQRLRDATRLYTVVENDVNALANAQKWFGAARMLESFSIVLVSYDGIGSAKFWDEELVHGATGKAGELGHYWIERNGPRCRCGKRGCVEALATGPAILNALSGVSWEQAQDLAAKGDREAVRAFVNAGDALGRGLSIMLTENDPGTVIFTGPAVTSSRGDDKLLVLYNDHYHDAMWKAVVEHTFGGTPPALEQFVIIKDEQNWNGARGAATTVIGDVITATVDI